MGFQTCSYFTPKLTFHVESKIILHLWSSYVHGVITCNFVLCDELSLRTPTKINRPPPWPNTANNGDALHTIILSADQSLVECQADYGWLHGVKVMTIQQSIMHAIAPFRVRGLCDEHQNHTFPTSTCFLEPISQHPIDHTYETGLLLRSCVLEETKASDIRHGERSWPWDGSKARPQNWGFVGMPSMKYFIIDIFTAWLACMSDFLYRYFEKCDIEMMYMVMIMYILWNLTVLCSFCAHNQWSGKHSRSRVVCSDGLHRDSARKSVGMTTKAISLLW
jgi:hypothetical protein